LFVTRKCCNLNILILLQICLPVQPAGNHSRWVVLLTRETMSYYVSGSISSSTSISILYLLYAIGLLSWSLPILPILFKDNGFFGLQRLLQHFGVQSFDFARIYYSYFRNTSCALKLIPTLLPKQYFNLHGLSCIGRKIETQSLTLHVSQRQTLSHKVILSTLCHGQ
jgi:hypothetical protein